MIICCNYGGILALVDVEVVSSERALPDHLLPLIQVRFEYFAVPLFRFLFLLVYDG